jgi:anti-anti-sigma factor
LDIKVHVRESSDDAYVVELGGEIDVYTSPKVKDAITELIDQGHYNLVINLEKVRYIDSTGLGVLIGGLKRVREHGGTRQPGLHESADQEDLRHHGPRENLRHLRRRGGREEGAGVNLPSRRSEHLGTVELRIPSKPEWVAVARLAVAAIANRLPFSVEEIEDLKLAIAEACTICIQQGVKRTVDRYRSATSRRSPTLRVDVRDHRYRERAGQRRGAPR